MPTERKTLVEFGAKHTTMTPKTYTVRLTIHRAYWWLDRIREIPESSSASSYLIEASGGSIAWKPTDLTPETDAFGEIVLVVRATDEHSADRAARVILTAAEAMTATTD